MVCFTMPSTFVFLSSVHVHVYRWWDEFMVLRDVKDKDMGSVVRRDWDGWLFVLF